MHLDGAEQRLRRILEKLSQDFRRKSVTHAEVPAASGSWRTCRVGEQQFEATAEISSPYSAIGVLMGHRPGQTHGAVLGSASFPACTSLRPSVNMAGVNMADENGIVESSFRSDFRNLVAKHPPFRYISSR